MKDKKRKGGKPQREKQNNVSHDSRKSTPKKKPNPLFLTVVITVALALLFGAVMGIILAVRNARAVVSYGGVRMDKGAASYLAATYKDIYIKKLIDNQIYAYDHEEFWEEEYEEGVTFGELLRSETENYIRSVAVGAYLFDRYSTLSREEKKNIRDAAEAVLSDKAGGDRKKFNEAAEAMGFDYSDFLRASELLYKAKQAKTLIYGNRGSVLESGAFPAECEKYMSTFSYVQLLFIRTEYEYETDGEGNYLRNPDGSLKRRELTAEELEERLADVEEVRRAIDAYENDSDNQMSPESFMSFLEKYPYDDYATTGYYLSVYSSYTYGFSEAVDLELTLELLDMEVGEYAEFDTEYGICFARCAEAEKNAYKQDSLSVFFSDFYSDAADYLYEEACLELMPEVTVKDRYAEIIDPVKTEANGEFVIPALFGVVIDEKKI